MWHRRSGILHRCPRYWYSCHFYCKQTMTGLGIQARNLYRLGIGSTYPLHRCVMHGDVSCCIEHQTSLEMMCHPLPLYIPPWAQAVSPPLLGHRNCRVQVPPHDADGRGPAVMTYLPENGCFTWECLQGMFAAADGPFDPLKLGIPNSQPQTLHGTAIGLPPQTKTLFQPPLAVSSPMAVPDRSCLGTFPKPAQTFEDGSLPEPQNHRTPRLLRVRSAPLCPMGCSWGVAGRIWMGSVKQPA